MLPRIKFLHMSKTGMEIFELLLCKQRKHESKPFARPSSARWHCVPVASSTSLAFRPPWLETALSVDPLPLCLQWKKNVM